MDTSIEYIKMCEKATEIQKLWRKPSPGDFVFLPTKSRVVVSPDDMETKGWLIGRYATRRFIWLPRQDQLQEILGIEDSCLIFGYDEFTPDWMNADERSLLGGLNTLLCKGKITFEKIWLRELMHENYNKVWDSTKQEWVNV